jgi:hypothetical protein
VGGTPFVDIRACWEIKIKEAVGHGGGAVAGDTRERNQLGMTCESRVEAVWCYVVVVAKEWADHDQSATCVVGWVIIEDAPGREASIERVVNPQAIKPGFLEENDVGGGGEVGDIF